MRYNGRAKRAGGAKARASRPLYFEGSVPGMTDRAAMKRRVRGLLRRKWQEPLLAWILSGLSFFLCCGVAAVFWNTLSAGLRGLAAPYLETLSLPVDLLTRLLVLYTQKAEVSGLVPALPGLAAMLGAHLFVGLPMAVTRSSYFNRTLRGKHPKISSVFSCFSSEYPRDLGGMLYAALYKFLWALMAFAMPLALYKGGELLIVHFAERLGLYQVYVLAGLMVFCAVWLIGFSIVLINRMIAYCLTPVCIAAQPRLPARRGVRLSRKLMRGHKWELIGLFLSFTPYFLPAIAAGAMQILLSLPGLAGEGLGWLRATLWALMGVFALAALLYVAPYWLGCFHAFYIERKREALEEGEVTTLDFIEGPQRGQPEAPAAPAEKKDAPPAPARSQEGAFEDTATLVGAMPPMREKRAGRGGKPPLPANEEGGEGAP